MTDSSSSATKTDTKTDSKTDKKSDTKADAATSDAADPTEFDVIVIGGGPAGENAAWYARDNGLSVAVVERELVGGECSYWACMPSKALLRPGEALAAARAVPGAAGAITGGVDVEETLKSRDAFSSHFDDKHQVQWLESIDASLFRGHGRLAGERTVEVTAEDGTVTTLTAIKGVIIATGTAAAIPPVEGLRDIRSWDSRDVTTVKQMPNSLLILGGGVVGVEMAQAYVRLGVTEVTIVELFERIMFREEPFVGVEIKAALEAEGITVLTSAKAVKATREADDAPATLHLEDGTTLTADELLVATGRRALTDDLGLETVGLEPGGSIAVDDRLRVTGTDADWLYVVGDANGRALLTHQGKYQGRIVGDVLAGKDVTAWADHVAVPRVAFTDPQVAAVGPTEREAREKGVDVKVLSAPTGGVAGASLYGRNVTGTSQLLVDRATDRVIGATFTGPLAGEMLHAATIAIIGELTLAKLWHAVPSFPTMSEIWLRLLEADRGV